MMPSHSLAQLKFCYAFYNLSFGDDVTKLLCKRLIVLGLE